MLVGPELPAGVTQQDMGDYGGALLPGRPACVFFKPQVYHDCRHTETHSVP